MLMVMLNNNQSFLDVNHDETVHVEYVDFGNEETLQFKDIKKIPDMYLNLPRQVDLLFHYFFNTHKTVLSYFLMLNTS